MYLEEVGLLDVESALHRICLFITFQQRIQRSLDETVASWNLHKVCTAGNKTPLAIYQLSREHAINRGYWTGDPGDALDTVDSLYGEDGDAGFPPANELTEDPPERGEDSPVDEERQAVVDDEEIQEAMSRLGDMDFNVDDGNYGLDFYVEAVGRLTACLPS